MSKITPCLWFAHEAEEAATFYVSLVPDSHIDHVHRNVGDGPSGAAGSVLMVVFKLAGRTFQALNGGSSAAFTHALSLSISCEDQAETDRLWNGLSAGGTTARCGWLKDRYGLSWQIVPKALPRLLGDSDRATSQRVMQAMLQMTKIDIAALERAAAG